MAVIARTISQLPRIERVSQPTSALVEVTDYNGGYISRAISYENFTKGVYGSVSADLSEQYNLSAISGDITIQNVVSKVGEMLSASTTFRGTKTFLGKVLYTSSATDDTALVNRTQVKQLVKTEGMYIKTGSYINGNAARTTPFNDDGLALHQTEVGEGDDFIRLAPTRESGYTETNVSVIANTGYLVMWGWPADCGSVDSKDAWVGLFFKNSSDMWVPLQMQPWIQGTHSADLQYVGFNVPVSSGLSVKVMTGFRMNMSQSAKQLPNSKTYKASNEPCNFFGYVLTQ